jgi:glycosyltransferase involved in cell wall biosynthesis
MSIKKVLIITYYWPPSGGSGVQRWLKFAKYLPEYGWEPIVFTPENPSYQIKDESLLQEIGPEIDVIKLPIWEPYTLWQKITGQQQNNQLDMADAAKQGCIGKIASWIRANFFIPDPRVFWVRPSVNILKEIITSNRIQHVITSGPPHSMHLIGLKLKNQIPSINWIADFRDPWSEWDLLATLGVKGYALRKHQMLEQKVLKSVAHVITVTPTYVQRFKALGARKVSLITNGYDEADFIALQKIKTDKFIIRHLGGIDVLRDPRPFLDALKDLLQQEDALFLTEKLSIEFIGTVNTKLKEEILTDVLLSKYCVFLPLVPHKEVPALFASSSMLLLILASQQLASGNIPGKLFEYMASACPVLGLGEPEGDSAQILEESGAGKVFARADAAGMQAFIMTQFNLWKSGGQNLQTNVQAYTRKNLTKQLVDLLES